MIDYATYADYTATPTPITTMTAEYIYDVNGDRIAKTVDADGSGSGAAVRTNFVVLDSEILLELNGQTLAYRYLPGPSIDMNLAIEDAATNDVLWSLPDHQGTVRDVVDDAGTVKNHIEYDTFGNITSESDDTVEYRFTYTGRELDAETALYYYRARYYDPATGQFISSDPIAFEAGDASLYRYVSNSPMMATDPTGQYGHDVHEDLSYILALAAGFKEKDARVVAKAAQAQDNKERYALNRLRSEWWYDTLIDLWHFPGAFSDGGKGRVDRQRNPQTTKMLNLLWDAALNGYAKETFKNYGHLGHGIRVVFRETLETEPCTRRYTAHYNRNTVNLSRLYGGRYAASTDAYYKIDAIGRADGYRETTIAIKVGPLPGHQLRMLGAYLHSMQDSFAHYKGKTGHPRRGSGTMASTHTDVTHLPENIKMARQMADLTYKKFRQFLQENKRYARRGGGAPLTYFQRALVEAYLSAKTERKQGAVYEAVLESLGIPMKDRKPYSGRKQDVSYKAVESVLGHFGVWFWDPGEIIGRGLHTIVAPIVQPLQK